MAEIIRFKQHQWNYLLAASKRELVFIKDKKERMKCFKRELAQSYRYTIAYEEALESFEMKYPEAEEGVENIQVE